MVAGTVSLPLLCNLLIDAVCVYLGSGISQALCMQSDAYAPLLAGAQEFKKLFEESMEKNGKFVSAAETAETAENAERNGAAAASEEKTQNKSADELAENIKEKVKVEDS